MCFVDRTAEWAQQIDSSCRNLGLGIVSNCCRLKQHQLPPPRPAHDSDALAPPCAGGEQAA